MKKIQIILVGMTEEDPRAGAILDTMMRLGLYTETDGFQSVAIGELRDAFLLYGQNAPITIIVGGLGFAPEDRAVKVIADTLSIPMEYDAEISAQIDAAVPESDPRKAAAYACAQLPKGSIVLENSTSLVPGCVIEGPENTVILLPGEPEAVSGMLKNRVMPYIENILQGKTEHHDLMIFGLTREQVLEKLEGRMGKINPTLTLKSDGLLHTLGIFGNAADSKTAESLVERTLSDLLRQLGTAAFGVDCESFEEVVVNLLIYNKLRVATAESCTGGRLSARLVNVPGASNVFDLGVTTYAADKKVNVLGVPVEVIQNFGEVSAETAVAMASGIQKLAFADFGVGITGIAGPKGGTPEKPVGLCYIAIADRNHALVRRLNLGSDKDRETIRETATLYALDFIRKYLMSYPNPLPGAVPLTQIEQNIRAAVMNTMMAARNNLPTMAPPLPAQYPGSYPPNSNWGIPMMVTPAQAQQNAIEYIVNERRK